jgi:hypothetical protein
LAVAVLNVAATAILGSDGYNFIVLAILSSKDMYCELNATIILDLCILERPF